MGCSSIMWIILFTANCNFWHTSAMKFDKTINRENWEKRGVKKRVASIERERGY